MKSFKTCGITVDTDGNEDSSIYCIKHGNPAAEAKSIIERRTTALLREDEDPFYFDSLDSDEICSDGEFSFHQKMKVNCSYEDKKFVKLLYCKQLSSTLLLLAIVYSCFESTCLKYNTIVPVAMCLILFVVQKRVSLLQMSFNLFK